MRRLVEVSWRSGRVTHLCRLVPRFCHVATPFASREAGHRARLRGGLLHFTFFKLPIMPANYPSCQSPRKPRLASSAVIRVAYLKPSTGFLRDPERSAVYFRLRIHLAGLPRPTLPRGWLYGGVTESNINTIRLDDPFDSRYKVSLEKQLRLIVSLCSVAVSVFSQPVTPVRI